MVYSFLQSIKYQRIVMSWYCHYQGRYISSYREAPSDSLPNFGFWKRVMDRLSSGQTWINSKDFVCVSVVGKHNVLQAVINCSLENRICYCFLYFSPSAWTNKVFLLHCQFWPRVAKSVNSRFVRAEGFITTASPSCCRNHGEPFHSVHLDLLFWETHDH